MSGSDRVQGNPALVAQPSGNSDAGQKAASWDNASGNQKAGQIAATIKHPTSPNEAAVANPQTHTAQLDQYQLRDLTAQEDMAYWAMWMFVAAVFTFIITSIGTWLIWRQVKLTRKAVEDTSEATEAMREANLIAKESQRPWVAISCRFDWFQKTQGSIEFSASIFFENLGSIIAESFCGMANAIVIHKGYSATESRAKSQWDEFRSGRENRHIAILPREKAPHIIQSIQHTDFLDDADGGDINKYILIIVAAAHYKFSGSSEWHVTERSFILGIKGQTEFGREWFGPDTPSRRHSADELKVRRGESGETS